MAVKTERETHIQTINFVYEVRSLESQVLLSTRLPRFTHSFVIWWFLVVKKLIALLRTTTTTTTIIIMRPSSLGGGRIMRRTLSVRLSVCLSVRPVIVTLPSVTTHDLANYKDTRTFRHALRAAYRTAISAAQILV